MTYLFFLRDLFINLQLSTKTVEIFFILWIHVYTLLGATQNLLCCFKCLITVRSSIGYNILSELFKLGHVWIHANDIDQQSFWLEVESFGVVDFEFQSFTGSQLIKTIVQGLSELFTKLFRNKWFLTMCGNLGHQLDHHITKLEAWFRSSRFIVIVLFSLVSLLLVKLIPFMGVFAHCFIITNFLER